MKAAAASFGLLVASALCAPASASAPEPRKPVDAVRFTGRWIEVAHTPNARERACSSATMEWASTGPDRFFMLQSCRRVRTGAVETVKAGARITDPRTNAKIQVGFFGGLIHSDYWILDHDDGYRWMIVSTSGGKFVWLLARDTGFEGAVRNQALQSLRSLGYDPAKLVYPALQFAGQGASTP
jgi:apolipoprotein D and lipocalin family protein